MTSGDWCGPCLLRTDDRIRPSCCRASPAADSLLQSKAVLWRIGRIGHLAGTQASDRNGSMHDWGSRCVAPCVTIWYTEPALAPALLHCATPVGLPSRAKNSNPYQRICRRRRAKTRTWADRTSLLSLLHISEKRVKMPAHAELPHTPHPHTHRDTTATAPTDVDQKVSSIRRPPRQKPIQPSPSLPQTHALPRLHASSRRHNASQQECAALTRPQQRACTPAPKAALILAVAVSLPKHEDIATSAMVRTRGTAAQQRRRSQMNTSSSWREKVFFASSSRRG